MMYEYGWVWSTGGKILTEENANAVRGRLKYDGTRLRMEGEVKGKLPNRVGSQYSYTPRNVVYPALLPLMRTPQLPAVDWADAPADLNGLVRFAERRNLVSAHVPSYFNWPLLREEQMLRIAVIFGRTFVLNVVFLHELVCLKMTGRPKRVVIFK
jgi:hypothetical protein